MTSHKATRWRSGKEKEPRKNLKDSDFGEKSFLFAARAGVRSDTADQQLKSNILLYERKNNLVINLHEYFLIIVCNEESLFRQSIKPFIK